MLRFNSFNPAASAIYFLSVLIISMFSKNFILLLLSLLGAILYLINTKGFVKFIKSFFGYIIMFLLVAATNPIFSHNGVTPLFFVNDVPVTLEAIVYGIVLGLMLLCAILWFSAVNIVFTSERLMYLFGKTLPKLALIFSMTLRFVPQFISVFKKIEAAQAQFGDKHKLKGLAAAFSSTVTVCLENSADVSNSMNARGFGISKRTFYSRFKFTGGDLIFVIFTLALFSVTALGVFSGELSFVIYPKIILPKLNFPSVLAYISFGALSFAPFFIEAWEGIKWKRSLSKI